MLDLWEVIESWTIDSIVTDPPYELNFMGKGWDNSGIAFQAETWKKCYDALKPWGYLLAFGGSRTFHRIACAIEDAGFEIRDTIMWLYGSGFPKSMNIANSIEGKIKLGSANKKDYKKLDGEKGITSLGYNKTNAQDGFRPNDYNGQETIIKVNYTTDLAKQWQGWGTALKPSYEPIIVARKPLEWSCTDNVIKYGVGGINIDECRVGISKNDFEINTKKASKNPTGKKATNVPFVEGIATLPNELGRFPANTILTYDESDFDEVCGGFPNTKSWTKMTFGSVRKAQPDNTYQLWFTKKENSWQTAPDNYWDSWSAARYYYTAKASKRDRDEGLDEFEQNKVNDGRNTPIDNAFQRWETLRKNTHPTVKPTDLMQYLVRLVTPNGWTVLDPFNWSGSTGKAVMYENKDRNKNYKYIWIELTDEYLPITKARIEYVINNGIEKEKEGEKAEWLHEQPLFF